MESILKNHPLLLKNSPHNKSDSGIRILVKRVISTKNNNGTEGRYGKFLGKTNNHMYILEIDGKIYNFYRKDLDITQENDKQIANHFLNRTSPKTTSTTTTTTKRSSPKTSTASPSSSEVERFANSFISMLKPSMADKFINAVCKRRTSRTKSPGRKSPVRTSPAKRRSPKKVSPKKASPKNSKCKKGQEISQKTGRCIEECKPDQERDWDPVTKTGTNRCRKRTSGAKKKTPPKIKLSPRISVKKSPKKPSPSIDDLNNFLVMDDNTANTANTADTTYITDVVPKSILKKRTPSPLKKRTPSPLDENFLVMDTDDQVEKLEPRIRPTRKEPQFITEEVDEGPFVKDEYDGLLEF